MMVSAGLTPRVIVDPDGRTIIEPVASADGPDSDANPFDIEADKLRKQKPSS
jgi:hypothetical protein